MIASGQLEMYDMGFKTLECRWQNHLNLILQSLPRGLNSKTLSTKEFENGQQTK